MKQESAINHQNILECYASYVCLSVSYCFVKMWLWRTLPNIFFTNLVRRKSMLRSWWSCRINNMAKSFRISESQIVSAVGCVLYFRKNVYQSPLKIHKLASDRNDPYLCDFFETHYLNDQVKFIKELNDCVTNLHKMGAQVWYVRLDLSVIITPWGSFNES